LAPDGTWPYASRVTLNNSGLTLDEVIKEDFFPPQTSFKLSIQRKEMGWASGFH
jgi:hypothetical protein